jgi:hypothetical protein
MGVCRPLGLLLLIGSVRLQAQPVTPTSGTVFVLREMRAAGRVVARYPLPRPACAEAPSLVVQSGWLTARGSWWVVVDTIGQCDRGGGNLRLSIRIDNGTMASAPDGRGLLFLPRAHSPLPGAPAVLRGMNGRPVSLGRADSLQLVGADTSTVFVYVRPPETR